MFNVQRTLCFTVAVESCVALIDICFVIFPCTEVFPLLQ